MSCHTFFNRIFRTAVTAVLLPLAATASLKAQGKELVIYAYDSFVAEWGPGPKVIPLFEKEYNCKVTLVSKGDAGQVLSAAVLEKAAPKADVLVGLDNNLVRKAIKADVLEAYTPKNIGLVASGLDFDPTHHLLPYDFGYFCLVWDSQKLANPPKTLADLTKPEYAKKLILMDPRTSTPGLGFLSTVVAAQGEKWPEFWKALKPAILTVTSGWDAGYGMFTQGEAPLVISYTTSPAYHVENDKTERYKAIVFPEGLVMQVEGAGIVKGARHADLAKAFIEFMLTPAFQNELPLTQWMYPVNPKVQLPASYRVAPKPAKVLKADPAILDKALAQWADIAAK
jgi:thiamine transport system substrate-binding protein